MHVAHLEKLFYPIPTKIIYCYGEYQKEFDEFSPNVKLVGGFPDNLSDMVRDHDNSLIVLDDLMSHCSNDQRVADLFTEYHYNPERGRRNVKRWNGKPGTRNRKRGTQEQKTRNAGTENPERRNGGTENLERWNGKPGTPEQKAQNAFFT